jgi:PAS domain S-box-containing protein
LKLLTNPVVLQMALLLVFAVCAFVVGVLLMRRLRREMTASPLPAAGARVESPGFTTAAYHGVIQQLKEKEQELQRLRQAAADRAAASEKVSAAVLANLASGVVLFNAAGLVQQANPAARQMLGYASVAGLHARDLFRGVSALRAELPHNQAPPTMAEAIEQALRQGRVCRRLETDYATPSGQQRVLGITVSPVTGGAGERLGAACLITELTEVRELTRQVRLRENLAALGEMSAGIAHEFKNSLATISGYGQMLTAENDGETVRQFAAKIHAETDALSRVVTDFLRLARPQALSAVPINVPELLQDCARECGVELVITDLPPAFAGCIVGDPTSLRQCFSNLLRNSAEAAPGTAIRVQVSGALEAGQARLVLRDNAGGIPPEVLPRIFIPFVTTKSHGTGLGLALVHRIVTDHGGSITVANDGPGAVFTLSFPAEKLEKKAAEAG